MRSETNTDLTLDELAERVRAGCAALEQAEQQAKQAMCNALHIALDLGDALIAAQSQVPAGQWECWLKDNCPRPRRSAYFYMQVAHHRPEIEVAREKNPKLSLRAAGRLIAKPKERDRGSACREEGESRAADLMTSFLAADDNVIVAAMCMLGFNRWFAGSPPSFLEELETRFFDRHLSTLQLVDLLERRLDHVGGNATVQLQKIRKQIEQSRPQIDLTAAHVAGSA
jgi:hypothetical protein